MGKKLHIWRVFANLDFVLDAYVNRLVIFCFHSYARNCTFIYFLLFMCFFLYLASPAFIFHTGTYLLHFSDQILHERTKNRKMHCCAKLHLLPLRSALVFDQLISWPVRRSLHTSSLKCRRKRDDSAKNPQQSLPGHHQAWNKVTSIIVTGRKCYRFKIWLSFL